MLKQVARVSLREQALDAIRASIVLGEIEPGVVYSAPSLAAQLGVSATPVREAMLDLVNEGVVEAVRNKGFRVIELDDKDLDEIFQLRLLLEVPAVREVAGRLGAKAQARLDADIATMELAATQRDLRRYLAADRSFHLTLLSEVGNRRLVRIVDRLREHTRLYGLQGLMDAEQLIQATAEHRQLLEAVVSGRAAEAGRLMADHVKHTRGVWAGIQEEAKALGGVGK